MNDILKEVETLKKMILDSKEYKDENFFNVFFQMAKKNSILYAVVIGDREKYSNIKEQASYLNNILGEENIFIIGATYELFNYY